MRKKHIYIAGPMRGYGDHNYSAFVRAADVFATDPDLRDVWTAVSPVDLAYRFGGPDQLDADPEQLKKLMDFELAAVKSCDAILLLGGWEKSAGARAELRVALDNDLEIYTQESGVLVR